MVTPVGINHESAKQILDLEQVVGITTYHKTID
jgi:hypothetical protein